MKPKVPEGHRATVVRRPLWREFSPSELSRAAAHVKRGGFSAVIDDRGRIKILLPRRRNGELAEMSLWALLALDYRRWGSARSGPARGLAAVIVKPIDRGIIQDWCERDAGHKGAKRTLTLDCLACGACCRDNRVVLEKQDFTAFRRAGRSELGKPPYTRTSRGTVVLRLTKGGACLHLGGDNRCGIYPLRPSNCSTFPVGAEPCLASREETLGIID